MTTLQGKIIVVVGGSSGIGFGVALAALQSLASIVIIASSNKVRVEDAVQRLKAHQLSGNVRGQVLDAKDADAVKSFATGLGAVDHIVWTSGDVPDGHQAGGAPYSTVQSPEEGQVAFSVRFWGPFVLAKHAKFHPGGSLTLTSGMAGQKPPRGGQLVASFSSAFDGLTRGLAVDLAPVRVNLVCPGVIETEIFDKLLGEMKTVALEAFKEKILLKRAGQPNEVAEAYLFLMKCGYITGKRIDVEGGWLLV